MNRPYQQQLRKHTENWWRAAWAEWKAAETGIYGISGIDRKARLLDGWQAARCLLGPDYRNDAGRAMEPTAMIAKWPWVRIGQHLRRWMTPDAKAAILDIVLDDYDRYCDEWDTLERAGIRLDNMTEKDDECYEDGECSDDEDHDNDDDIIDLTAGNDQSRPWWVEGKRKRGAKAVMEDETAPAEDRRLATE